MLAGLADIGATVRDRTLGDIGKTQAPVPRLDLTVEDSAAREDPERDAVVIWATAMKQRVRCIVSREALDDCYDADGLDKARGMRKPRDNRREIEALIPEGRSTSMIRSKSQA